MEHSALKHPKVLPRKELERLSQTLRTGGDRLVLTNGCFDLLHVGHVRYLRAARALGDRLIVALNSDRSVRRLKGQGHPITRQQDRAEILSALESVDFVTVFDDDSAVSVVMALHPDIYVKGGDYSAIPGAPNFPVEAAQVQSYGGEVRIVDLVPGYSTTGLLQRLRGIGAL